jgi:hypothetical protein
MQPLSKKMTRQKKKKSKRQLKTDGDYICIGFCCSHWLLLFLVVITALHTQVTPAVNYLAPVSQTPSTDRTTRSRMKPAKKGFLQCPVPRAGPWCVRERWHSCPSLPCSPSTLVCVTAWQAAGSLGILHIHQNTLKLLTPIHMFKDLPHSRIALHSTRTAKHFEITHN